MIQLHSSGTHVDAETVARLEQEFHGRHLVLLPKLLEPKLLEFVLSRIEQGPWQTKIHEKIGSEVVLGDILLRNMLHLVTNAPGFLEAVRKISGCGNITWFRGRIYRFIPGQGHYDSWHTDHMDRRVVAMSLNLSSKVYEGGILQLRDRNSKQILLETANTGCGDAVLFRISEDLDHRVTDVTGKEPKTAFAGWFKSGRPDFLSRLHASSID